MIRFARAYAAAGISLATLSLTGAASAHTVLVSPAPLTANDDAKTDPCGCTFGSGTIICPPDYPVTEVQAGAQVSITWNETVQHTGEFRLSFAAKAPEDVTQADMDDSVLQMVVPDDQMGGLVTQSFTMPSTPCDLCTIQVRQFMEGADPPYYFTCAAVRIVDGAGGGAASGTTSGAGPSGAGGGSSGSAGDGTGGADQWQPEPQDGCAWSGKTPGSGDGARSILVLGTAIALAFAARRRNA
jgi:hypothetical protein